MTCYVPKLSIRIPEYNYYPPIVATENTEELLVIEENKSTFKFYSYSPRRFQFNFKRRRCSRFQPSFFQIHDIQPFPIKNVETISKIDF